MTGDAQPIDLGILLGLAYQEFVRELREHHERLGFDVLGRSDGFVFRALADGPRTITDLAQRLQITKQGAGQIIDDMQARGYVERMADPGDKRAKLVGLSVRGRAALAAAREFHGWYADQLVRVHGEEAVTTLRTLLTAIAGPDQAVDPRLRALYL